MTGNLWDRAGGPSGRLELRAVMLSPEPPVSWGLMAKVAPEQEGLRKVEKRRAELSSQGRSCYEQDAAVSLQQQGKSKKPDLRVNSREKASLKPGLAGFLRPWGYHIAGKAWQSSETQTPSPLFSNGPQKAMGFRTEYYKSC